MAVSSVPRKHVRCLDQRVLWNEGQGLGRRIYQLWNLANLRKPIVLRSTAQHEGHMLQWASITVPGNGDTVLELSTKSLDFSTQYSEKYFINFLTDQATVSDACSTRGPPNMGMSWKFGSLVDSSVRYGTQPRQCCNALCLSTGDTTVSEPPQSWNFDFFTKITLYHSYISPGTI